GVQPLSLAIGATEPTPIHDVFEGPPRKRKLPSGTRDIDKLKIWNRPMLFEIRFDAGPHSILFGQNPDVAVLGDLCRALPANAWLGAPVRTTGARRQEYTRTAFY